MMDSHDFDCRFCNPINYTEITGDSFPEVWVIAFGKLTTEQRKFWDSLNNAENFLDRDVSVLGRIFGNVLPDGIQVSNALWRPD